MLHINNLSITFKNSEKDVMAVKELSFKVKKGSFFGIAGESGSGKTQTMLSIMALLEPTASVSGSIIFNDVNLLSLSEAQINQVRSDKISIIFQDPMTSLNPFLTIGSQLTEVLIYHKNYSKTAAIKRSIEFLELVQLDNADTLMRRYPHELSGGMRQRVAIAMALLCEPELLIADEATTALDVIVQSDILALLKKLKKQLDMTIIMITHDLAVISECCDDVMIMHQGELKEIGSVKTIFKQPSDIYTKQLLAAVPKIKKGKSKKQTFAISSRGSILSTNKLSVQYVTETHLFGKPAITKAVDTISFDVYEGETLGIVGESGCGKSSLARTLIGLHEPSSGKITSNGYPISDLIERGEYNKDVQIIFQDPLASLNPRMTIADIIAEPLQVFEPTLNPNQRKEKVLAMLEDVGLDATMINRYPHEFSGGQCQRISIARSLISRPKILVCDEPVSALDVSIQEQILKLLQKLKTKFQLTILFISHDLSVVQQMSDHVMVMYKGKIVEYGPKDQIYNQPKHDYTKKLLAAVPTL
tara:strand:+ start:1931 stop:3523 length:1593 start_codon:yes stop_codon:yes gene_type:complete